MRYSGLLWGSILLLFFSFPALATDVATLVSQAREQVKSQAYDDAERTLERAISAQKDNLEARFLLARISVLREDYREAIKRFKYLLFLDPKNVPAMAGLALSAEKLGDDKQAKQAYIRALKQEPEQLKWLFEIVRIDMKDIRYNSGTERRLKKLIRAKFREQESLRYIIDYYNSGGMQYKAKKYEKMLASTEQGMTPSHEQGNVSRPASPEPVQVKTQNPSELERQFSRLQQACAEQFSKGRLSQGEQVLRKVSGLISRNPEADATLNGMHQLLSDPQVWNGRDNLQMRYLVQWENVPGISHKLKAYLTATRATLVYRVGFIDEGIRLFNEASDIDAHELWKMGVHLHMGQPQPLAFLDGGMPLSLVGGMMLKGASHLKQGEADQLRMLVDYARFASAAGQPALALLAVRHIRQQIPNQDQEGRARVAMVEALALATQGRSDAAYKTLITFGLIPHSVSNWVTGKEARLFAPLYRDRRKLSFVLGIETATLPASVKPYPSPQPYPDMYGKMKTPPAAPQIRLAPAGAPAGETPAKPPPRNVSPSRPNPGDGDILILE